MLLKNTLFSKEPILFSLTSIEERLDLRIIYTKRNSNQFLYKIDVLILSMSNLCPALADVKHTVLQTLVPW